MWAHEFVGRCSAEQSERFELRDCDKCFGQVSAPDRQQVL